MLLSRFWYLLLVFTAVAFGALFLLTQNAFNRQYDSALGDQLRRDRFEMEFMLRVDARARIDSMAGFSVNADVRSALKEASAGRVREPEALKAALTRKLTELNGQLDELAGDIVFAVDRRGQIVASVGIENPPADAGLGAFPLVERALLGFTRDDIWVFNDKVYRMAARPVIEDSGYVGAIVHGIEIDDEFAQRLSQWLNGATVVFFKGDVTVGSHMPAIENAARAEDVGGGLEAALADPAVASGETTAPVDIAAGTARARYFLITGAASHAQVGYAIARPRLSIATAAGLLEQVSVDDLGTVSPTMWGVLGGFAVLAFLMAMFFLWLERDRPLRKLRAAATDFSGGQASRFDPAAFGGIQRTITQAINEGLDKNAHTVGAAGRPAANLDEILSPAETNQATPSFFGFDAQSMPPSEAPGPMDLPSIPAAGMHRPITGELKPTVKSDPGGLPAPQPPAAPAMAMPPAPAPPSPPAMAAGNKPAWAKGTLLGVGGNAPGLPAAPAAPAPSTGAINYSAIDDDDEGETMVAAIPEELLAQAMQNANQGGAEDEQSHFRSVFDQFVATKKQCGESTSGLTFEKFEKTLKKNRDQIISQHGAKSVRFTVYVKAGKAALKATPVRT